MYRVLLVSDNRILLKQLYEYFDKETQFEALVVPFSTYTYERFVADKSDFVVFDSANMIPFTKILQLLSQCQWNYHVILLSDRAETKCEDPHVIILEKKNLSGQYLIDTLMMAAQTQEIIQSGNIAVSLEWNGHIEFISYPDAYYILIAKYIGGTKETISNMELEKFRSYILHAGELESISVSGRDLIISMRKSKMRSGFEFSELAKIVNAVFGNEYAIFFQENVSWTKLNQAYAQLTAASKYGYFLAGESIEMCELNKRVINLPQNDAHDILWRILYSVLLGQSEETGRLLKELYLRQLKYSLDIYMRGYIRHNFLVMQNILVSVTRTEPIEIPQSYSAIEYEYSVMEGILKSVCNSINSRYPLNPITIKAMTKIYRSYFEEISLESVSSELSVNKIYLGRLFREQIGMTVLDFLQEIRYEMACYMLKNSTHKIAIVARAVGYSDPGYFSRIFKKRAGVTPEVYRALK